jgi:hypothetical protein
VGLITEESDKGCRHVVSARQRVPKQLGRHSLSL